MSVPKWRRSGSKLDAFEDKEYLAECLQLVEGMYADLGIEMNVNKTKICRIDKGFKF